MYKPLLYQQMNFCLPTIQVANLHQPELPCTSRSGLDDNLLSLQPTQKVPDDLSRHVSTSEDIRYPQNLPPNQPQRPLHRYQPRPPSFVQETYPKITSVFKFTSHSLNTALAKRKSNPNAKTFGLLN
jgi:hypothetical protein